MPWGAAPATAMPAEFIAQWRRACRDRGWSNAWTHTIPKRSLDALRSLATDGPAYGSELAARIGATQPSLTSNTMPNLETLGFVSSTEFTSPSRRQARLWSLTAHGRELLEHDR